MMDEKEYIIQLFRRNFEQYKSKRIVIYGIGANTKTILDNCVDYQIVALMDAVMEGNILWDKQIIGVSELKDYQADMVVIVARYCNVSIIYERIAKYCSEKQIPVYDLNGNQFCEETSQSAYMPMNVNREKMSELINANEIISFDLFDTLIMRKVLHPADVFEIVENKAKKTGLPQIGFAKLRVMAERKVNGEMIPDIYDIYEEMERESNADKEILKQYMELELETEMQVLVVRKGMKDIFDDAIGHGKKVYLISDMYWPKKVLEEILGKLGISGYQQLFVSCEYRETKGTRLFDVFKEQVKAGSYLHVGDNYEIDYLRAKRSGMDAYHILSAYEMLKASESRKLLGNEEKLNLEARCMMGFYIAKAFSDPFLFQDSEGKAVVTTEREFGYMFLGAVITEFVLWIIELMKNQDGTVFFTARDGYILKEVYDEYRKEEREEKLPDSEYFLTSRMSSVLSGLLSNQDILFAADLPFSGTMEEKLEKRFLLSPNDIEKKLPNETDRDYVLRHRDKILERSRQFNGNYEKYLQSVYCGNPVYWVDFASSGTCQYYFEKKTEKTVCGLYFCRFIVDSEEKRRLHIESLYGSAFAYEGNRWLLKSYLFLENIFTSYQPTLKYFDEEGKPVYWEEKRTREQISSLKEIHQGIREYFEEYISLGLKHSGILDIPDGLLGCMWKKYSRIEIDFFKDSVLEDEFANRAFGVKEIIREE